MSVQVNQYLIYGAILSYEEYGKPDGGYERFEKYIDSAFEVDDINPGGLHCLFDGMNGNYIVIGRCLKKSLNGEPLPSMAVPLIDKDFAEMTRLLVRSELGINEQMALHLIKHYR